MPYYQTELVLNISEGLELSKLFKIDPPHDPREIRTLISLFTGAGGLDIGFDRAGFQTIWANEFDKSISPSFCNYFPKVEFDGRSIRDIPNCAIPSGVTGVIGGPPCQSWSEAGARRGMSDPRGELFYEYLRVIEHAHPLFFVAENVHGLVHSRNQEIFKKLIGMFEETGYTVSWKLLRASDFGVAQDRERVFIVGYDKSIGMKFEFPKPLPAKVTLKDAIGDLASLPLGDTSKVMNHELLDSGYSSIFMSRNRVRNWDEQSYTILATDRHIPFHPQAPKMIPLENGRRGFPPGSESLYRRLSIRECARIQSFPDDYEFLYTNLRTAYKMIGNAVPVELAFHVASAIREDLCKL